jgi:hypothetical protein
MMPIFYIDARCCFLLCCGLLARATSWQQVDEELQQGSQAGTAAAAAAAAATGIPTTAVSLQDQIKQDLERLLGRVEQQQQQQQQQQQPAPLGLAAAGRLRKVQQQGSDAFNSQGADSATGRLPSGQ